MPGIFFLQVPGYQISGLSSTSTHLVILLILFWRLEQSKPPPQFTGLWSANHEGLSFIVLINFPLSPCEHPHLLLPKASMWFFRKHVILVCVLIGSYYDLTFIFLLLSLKAFKIPTQSPSGTAPSCIARVTLPLSFCPPRPLSSPFL